MCSYRIQRSPEGGEGGAPGAEPLVSIPRAELEELRARAEAAGRPAESAESADGARRVAELERSFKEALRDRELATALAGRPLVSGAAAQLIKLWREDFDVYEDGGAFRVTGRDGRAVDQVVAERLAGADYAHFCPPSSRGGTAARNPARPGLPGGADGPPRTLGEMIVQRWRADAAERPGAHPPFGLGRRR